MLTLFFSLFAVMCPVHAELPQPPRAGAYTLGGTFQYFDSGANYLTDGSSQGLAGGGHFTHMLGSARLDYAWSSMWRSYAGFSYAYTQSTAAGIDRTNSGLNEMLIGTQAWWRVENFYLAPQVDLTYPFWHIDEDSDGALLGEGALQLQAGVWGLWRLGSLQPFGYLGYDYRDGDRAALLPYALGVYLRPAGWWVQGEYRGYVSVSDDADTPNRTPRELYTTRVDGGSFRFYSVNPSLGELALSGGVHFGAWSVFAEFAKTMNGVSQADGWMGLAGLSFGGRHAVSSDSEDRGGGNGYSDEPAFETEKDKYDESLFIDDVGGGRSKVRRRVRKQPSVDKLLNETEKELNKQY
jgi:hypothetical protein